jgi:hypothetical protein
MKNRISFSARHLLGLFALGLCFRLLGLTLVDFTPVKGGDSDFYTLMADNIVDHGTLSISFSSPFEPTVFRPPLYPFFISLLRRWPLSSFEMIVAFSQTVLMTASALFLALQLARYVPRFKTLLLMLFMLNPFDGFFASSVISDPMSTVLFAVAFAFFISPYRFRYWASGVFLGLLVLNRDIYLVLPVFLVAASLWVHRKNMLRRMKKLMPLLVCFGVTVLPWTVRNYLQFNQLILVSKGLMGFNLWVGTWEQNGEWITEPRNFPEYAFREPNQRRDVEQWLRQPAIQFDPQFKALTVQNYRENPLSILVTCLKRHYKLWLGSRSDLVTFKPTLLPKGGTPWVALKASLWGWCIAVFMFGFAGFGWRHRKSQRGRLVSFYCLVPLAMTSVTYFPFHNIETRYSYPVFQLLLVGMVLFGSSLTKFFVRADTNGT